jgi:hypothetical protein
MPTNAHPNEARLSGRHPATGLAALALASVFSFTACDSKGSSASPALGGSGGSSGSGMGFGGMKAMGGMMSMGAGGFIGPMAGSSGNGAGGSSGSSDAGDQLPPVNEMGMTTAKFCNALVPKDGTSLDLVLELGSTAVRFPAASGACSPASGACTAIPAGTIPYRLSYKNMTQEEGVAQFTAGKPVIIVIFLDENGTIQFGPIQTPAGQTCDSFQLPPIDTGDGGAPGPKPDASIPGGKI